MAETPPKMKKRQITLGSALDGFEPSPVSTPTDDADLAAGVFFSPVSRKMYVKSVQTVGPFPPVSAPGRVRWDLVYLDETGTAARQGGVEQIAPVPDYTGAPGNGSAVPVAKFFPIAWVKVDESALVVVDEDDITDIRGYLSLEEMGVDGDLLADNPGAVGVMGSAREYAGAAHRHPANVDSVDPEGVDYAPDPGVSFIYSRRDHVHAINPSVLPPLAKSTTCLWVPYDNSAGGNPNVRKWVLHRFQARAYNDNGFWFNIDSHGGGGNPEVLTLWPNSTGAGDPLNRGPGYADGTNPGAVASQWLYVYVIGVPGTSTYALVYSTNPPSTGPDLTASEFTVPGYTVWRWVTCIEQSGTAGLMVAARKFDNLVLKEWPTGNYYGTVNRGGHVEDLYWNADTGGFIGVPLNEHVSPMGMAALMFFGMRADSATILTLQLNLAPGTVMGEQDPPDAIFAPGALVIRLQNITTLVSDFENLEVWLPLNVTRAFYMDFDLSGVDAVGSLWGRVAGYMEINDYRNEGVDWSP